MMSIAANDSKGWRAVHVAQGDVNMHLEREVGDKLVDVSAGSFWLFFNDALFYNIIYDYALLCICFHVGDWNSLLVIDVVRFMLFQMLFRQ